MVGDRPLHRDARGDRALVDQLGQQFDHQDDLDVVLVTEVLRVVLGEGDVVVRVEDQHPLGAGGAPVVQVVPSEPLRLLGVAHLGGGAATAPLLTHQAEPVPGGLQDLGDRAGDRRAVEGCLAVDEQDRLAADADVQALGPVAHVVLADHGVAEDRLVGLLIGADVPGLPVGLVDALVHRQRPDRLDHVDRTGPETVEVAGEERIGAAELARAALGAVDVVGRDVLDLHLTLLEGDDVGVEGGQGPRLVPGDLHDRAHLAAELGPEE